MTRHEAPFEFDHISILTRVGAPESAILEKIGLNRGEAVNEPNGLGISSTSFFFANAYLKLLWAHEGELAQEAFSLVHYDLDARARWQDTFASPFGIMLRHKPGKESPPPFPTEPLKVDGQIIEFSAQYSGEPAYGFLPNQFAYPTFTDTVGALDHGLGLKEITRATISVYDDLDLSPLASWLTENQLAIIRRSAFANLEIEFDHGTRGESINLRPDLPVVLRY